LTDQEAQSFLLSFLDDIQGDQLLGSGAGKISVCSWRSWGWVQDLSELLMVLFDRGKLFLSESPNANKFFRL
jgi:hypothetical protein